MPANWPETSLRKTVTFSVLACLSFVNADEVSLTDAETADALNREDELGRLVLSAFSFDIPPFDEVSANCAGEEAG